MSENFEETGIDTSPSESVELTKNSKGYNWKIKLRDMNNIDLQLDRLDAINKRMLEKYGSAY